MELRQLRYFVRIVDLGSMSRAALDLSMVQSALSQQISRLESELSTLLLQRTPRGVIPTEAGMAFYREAQLTLRHAAQAMRSAQQARLSGSVSVGLAPSTASILGLPLMRAMRQRYPDVHLHMAEGMPDHLSNMLTARSINLAVLFDSRMGGLRTQREGRGWQALPLLDESLFLIRARSPQEPHDGGSTTLAALANEPLIVPTARHGGLRNALDAAFHNIHSTPTIVLEIDSLAMAMSAVDAGLGSTIQPWASMARFADAKDRFTCIRITDRDVLRTNLLCSPVDDELPPAALATRVVLHDCVRSLMGSGQWQGTQAIATAPNATVGTINALASKQKTF